jgi:hypothetical protein
MIRAFAVYEGDLDPDRYERHTEVARRVPGATFRHGKVFGAAGDQKFHYYAEFEWPDLDAFKEASRSDEFMETGKDAMEMGVPFSIHFAELA